MAKDKNKKKIENYSNFDDVLDSINKEFGNGSLVQGKNNYVRVETFSSDIIAIDVALGCKGIPQGRIIEIYGPESSGKTTFCLSLISACQKSYFDKKARYGKVVIIDAEHAFDPTWASNIGVDLDKLAISQPSSGEEALRICEKLAASKLVDLIIVDSVAALTPKSEIDGEIGDIHVGAQARMMSQALRKLVGVCSKTMTTIIFINQIREKVGIMFGSPETTPGGRALKFYSSIRGQISKGSPIKDGEEVVGFRPKIKFVKNKVGPPFTEAEFDICFGCDSRPVYGIDGLSSLIETATDHGIIERKGSHYKYLDTSLGNGTSRARQFLAENPNIANDISQLTYSKIFGDINQDEAAIVNIADEIIDEDYGDDE